MNIREKTERPTAPSERVRVKRVHERGAYDQATVNGILDAWPVCHSTDSIRLTGTCQ